MNVIFAPEDLANIPYREPTIFLAGPTPRSENAQTWRKGAIEIFEREAFRGTLLVPEDRSWQFKCSYDEQIEWEERGLFAASCIMFWVPRSLPDMPGFTTNDEWGFWKKSGKCVGKPTRSREGVIPAILRPKIQGSCLRLSRGRLPECHQNGGAP